MEATVIPGGVVLETDVCDEPCRHRECATGWQIVRTPCGLDCGDPIGLGQQYLETDEHDLVHRDCWLDMYESTPDDYGTPAVEQAAGGRPPIFYAMWWPGEVGS